MVADRAGYRAMVSCRLELTFGPHAVQRDHTGCGFAGGCETGGIFPVWLPAPSTSSHTPVPPSLGMYPGRR
jgi:hypothetical protein